MLCLICIMHHATVVADLMRENDFQEQWLNFMKGALCGTISREGLSGGAANQITELDTRGIEHKIYSSKCPISKNALVYEQAKHGVSHWLCTL